jgi:hypothetical protein
MQDETSQLQYTPAGKGLREFLATRDGAQPWQIEDD